MLTPGETIDNATLCRLFRVGKMGGIRRSIDANHLVLIADWTRTSGVTNRWEGDVLHFVGQGKGDQELTRFNRALARLPFTHEDLHLFEVHQPGLFTYRGRAILAGEPVFEAQPGDDGRLRRVVVFPIRLRTAADPDPLRHLGAAALPPTPAYLPAGAHAVIGEPPAGSVQQLAQFLDQIRELGVTVIDRRAVDDAVYEDGRGRWIRAVDESLRRAARERVAEFRARAAGEDRPWPYASDEIDIADDADDDRVRHVLELLGVGDEFARMRDAAFASAQLPEPPAHEPEPPLPATAPRDFIDEHRRRRPR